MLSNHDSEQYRRRVGQFAAEVFELVPVKQRERYLELLGNLSLSGIESAAAAQAERERLKRDAITDPLTGLLNRRGFEHDFNHLLERRVRGVTDTVLSLTVCDIDHFKSVNDTFGHDAGDEVIRDIAGLLTAQSRAADTVARIGGEEFALLSEQPVDRVSDFTTAMRRMQSAVTTEIEGRPVTISMGTVLWDPTRMDFDMNGALQAADGLLYNVKRGGRNNVAVAMLL